MLIDLKKNLKVCVCYHRPAFVFEEECFVPMWSGKDVAHEISKEGSALSEEQIDWMEKHCVGDNTGDNISKENRKYSEITVLYWVWKNYAKNIGLTEKNILNILENYDGIVACNDTKQSIRNYNETHCSQDIKYYNKTLEIIDNDWPDISFAAHHYEKETYHSWSQCFVIQKEHFFEYCEFLFDVLKKLDVFCKDDYQKLSVEQQRILGYAAENLWGIYWRYLTDKGLKFKCVPLIFNKNPFI